MTRPRKNDKDPKAPTAIRKGQPDPQPGDEAFVAPADAPTGDHQSYHIVEGVTYYVTCYCSLHANHHR